MSKRIWIALVTVTPRPGTTHPEGTIGACVNILAIADGPAEYKRMVIEDCDAFGQDVEDISEVELLVEREARYGVVQELRVIAGNLRGVAGLLRSGVHAGDLVRSDIPAGALVAYDEFFWFEKRE